jgi:hypothetical protein
VKSARLAVFALCASVIALSPAEAGAQLGGLMNKAKAKVKEAAQPPAKRPPAPAFDDRVLEITSARVDALIRGLESERSIMLASTPKGLAAWREREQKAYQERRKTYEAQTASFQKDMAAWEAKAAPVNKCRDAVDRKYSSNPRDPKKQAEYDACGDPGVGPARPDVPEPRPPASKPDDVDPVEAGASAAGMTSTQYSIIKERVAYLVSIRADFSNAKAATGYGFADSEAEAVRGKLAVLEPHRCILENTDCK